MLLLLIAVFDYLGRRWSADLQVPLRLPHVRHLLLRSWGNQESPLQVSFFFLLDSGMGHYCALDMRIWGCERYFYFFIFLASRNVSGYLPFRLEKKMAAFRRAMVRECCRCMSPLSFSAHVLWPHLAPLRYSRNTCALISLFARSVCVCAFFIFSN